MSRRCCAFPGRVHVTRLTLLALCLGSLLVCSFSLPGRRRNDESRVVTLHHEQTIATLYLGPGGNLTQCQVLEVNYPNEEREALARISRERPVAEVSFSRLLRTLLLCQQLDPLSVTSSGDVSSHRRQRETGWSSLTLLRGLVPGTKWCGIGDTATAWNDLGLNSGLDRCCRTHDLCPVKVKAYKRKYGLFNWSIYTKSHCACDQAFLQCLKAVDSRSADGIGHFYFDVLRPKCVRPKSCAPHENPIICTEREKAGVEPAYRFADAMRGYYDDWLPSGGRHIFTPKNANGADVSTSSVVKKADAPSHLRWLVERTPEISGGSKDHPTVYRKPSPTDVTDSMPPEEAVRSDKLAKNNPARSTDGIYNNESSGGFLRVFPALEGHRTGTKHRGVR